MARSCTLKIASHWSFLNQYSFSVRASVRGGVTLEVLRNGSSSKKRIQSGRGRCDLGIVVSCRSKGILWQASGQASSRVLAVSAPNTLHSPARGSFRHPPSHSLQWIRGSELFLNVDPTAVGSHSDYSGHGRGVGVPTLTADSRAMQGSILCSVESRALALNRLATGKGCHGVL